MILRDIVFLVVLVAGGVKPLLSSGPKETFTTEQRCYIFTHLAKAGGTTISRILKLWAKTKPHLYSLRYDTDEWKKGTKYAKRVAHEMGDFALIYGGYPEALRPHVGDECKWFTLTRHPVPRVVSAYYYCQKSPKDQCCASMEVDAKKVDLNTFAEHWSDYGLRQFALTFVLPEPVLQSEKAKKCKDCPGWYLFKTYLEERTHEELRSGLHEFLGPTQELLKSNYTAVGILEQMNSTMQLYNAALQIPGLDWTRELDLVGSVNMAPIRSPERARLLKSSWLDENLLKTLELDTLLYEYAVSIHRDQLTKYDLPWFLSV